MDVGFLPVLLLLVLVRIVGMGEWRVVVLVGVGRRQVRPLLALDEVVGDVGVLVVVYLSVMTVLLGGHHTLLADCGSGPFIVIHAASIPDRVGDDPRRRGWVPGGGQKKTGSAGRR